MSSTMMIAARGRVIGLKDGFIIFNPSDTNYELQLIAPHHPAPIGARVEGTIRVRARKILTVPSGGNFIAPMFGPPRTIQGTVRALDQQSMIVHAGTPILVEFPDADWGFDLNNGPITVGAMVNVLALPGASFEAVKS